VAVRGYRIFDIHTHFPTLAEHSFAGSLDEEYITTFGQAKYDYLKRLEWEASRARWDAYGMAYPSKDQGSDEEVIRLWDEDRRKKGIDKVVFVSGGGNRHLARIIEDYPDFLGLAHHHPEEPGAALELRRAVIEDGLVGYKILAPTVRRPLSEPFFYPIWETAEELDIPILIHFGILGGGAGVVGRPNCNPFALEEVAKGFPYLNFIIPHFGAGYMRELLLLGWGCKNIYVDTSGSNQWINWMPYKISKKEVLARFADSFGVDKILYGTDSSFLPRGYVTSYLEEWLDICEGLGFTESEKEQFFSSNAERLFRTALSK